MIEKTAERLHYQDSANRYVFARSLLAYIEAAKIVSGDVLELGTGQGYGIEFIAPVSERFVTLDKFRPQEDLLQPDRVEFMQTTFPPFEGIADAEFDYIISFQVIEHIEDDSHFVSEMYRVLRPGGQAIITTPNKPLSLTRNPWHVREYTPEELKVKLSERFESIEQLGVFGNEKI